MEGQRIILNDGTVIENGRAGYYQGALWCYFDGRTIGEAIQLFTNADRTARIVFQYGEMEDVYEGFTDCFHVSVADGSISVGLKKGENAEA